jgi:glucan phosphoethanolaminetransferase (alkaline phosphatase superfamily)
VSPRPSAGELLARVVAAAGLGYDAYAHLDLASRFDANTAVISQGMLFRVETVLAVLAALGVLLTRWRAAVIFALLVAGSALGAVLLYRYVDVGVLGPLPNMYEPAWYPEKTLSAVAEALAVLALAAQLLFGSEWRR